MGIINQQAFLFLTCVKTGIIMGVLYDLVRALRKSTSHPNWLVQLEDLLYWVACGCFAFVMVYFRNYGEIRVFVFIGILIGTVLYFSTLSKVIVEIMAKVIRRFVLIPIRCIILTIQIPINYTLKTYRKISIRQKRRRAHMMSQLKIIKAKK